MKRTMWDRRVVPVLIFCISLARLATGQNGQDIGQPAQLGSDSFDGVTWQVTGGGADIGGSQDQFHYVYVPLYGDGELAARVVSLTPTDPWAKAGVMIRETLAADSRYVAAFVTRDGRQTMQVRYVAGGDTSAYYTDPRSTLFPLRPYYVKLVRSGDIIKGYISLDGLNWHALTGATSDDSGGPSGNPVTLPMMGPIYIGLAVTSHNDSTLATGAFDYVSFDTRLAQSPSPAYGARGLPVEVVLTWQDPLGAANVSYDVYLGDSPAQMVQVVADKKANVYDTPGDLHSGTTYYWRVDVRDGAALYTGYLWTFTTAESSSAPIEMLDQDIGSPALAGAAMLEQGVWTVTGAGEDIWDNSDQFHYVYTTLSGDGGLSARVISLAHSYPWAKAGIMIRDTLDAGSKHVFILLTPVGRQVMHNRSVTGGCTSSYHTDAGATPFPSRPYYLRLLRQGDQFAGYVSSDGLTWQLMQADQYDNSGGGPNGNPVRVAMGDEVYVGLAVTSNEAATSATAVFDQISFEMRQARLPNPSDGVLNVGLNAILSWQNPPRSTDVSYDVYFGAQDPAHMMKVVDNQKVNAYDPPGDLVSATTYYWRVDVREGATLSTGSLWSFTTMGHQELMAHQDIGLPALSGSYSTAGANWIISAAGEDIWDSSDQFHFVYAPLHGDGELSARLISVTPIHEWTKAGIMIRENLMANSRFVYLLLTPDARVAMHNRPATAQRCNSYHTDNHALDVPCFLKLVRTGQAFTGYVSADGTDWQVMTGTIYDNTGGGPNGNPVQIPMAEDAYIGLAVTSNDTAALTTALFDHVSFSPSSKTGQQ